MVMTVWRVVAAPRAAALENARVFLLLLSLLLLGAAAAGEYEGDEEGVLSSPAAAPASTCRTKECRASAIANSSMPPGTVWRRRRLFGHDTNEEAENCPCRDPMNPNDEESCYMPVCDEGYYKCCSECDVSTCVGEVTMTMSKRGILECIQCYPGDFCNGCDRFERCDPVAKLESEIENKRASQKNKAEQIRKAEAERENMKRMVSKKGTAEAYDCRSCREGKYPYLDYSACIDDYNSVCNEKYLRRCMNRCGSEKGASYEMTKCEEMMCLMYCAKDWSLECAAQFKDRCLFLLEPPTEEQMAIAAENQDAKDIRIEEIEEFIPGCPVDCNTANPRAGVPTTRWWSGLGLLLLLLASPQVVTS